jgi:hypothetical protein
MEGLLTISLRNKLKTSLKSSGEILENSKIDLKKIPVADFSNGSSISETCFCYGCLPNKYKHSFCCFLLLARYLFSIQLSSGVVLEEPSIYFYFLFIYFFFGAPWPYYTVFSGAGVVSGTLHSAVWDTHISS